MPKWSKHFSSELGVCFSSVNVVTVGVPEQSRASEGQRRLGYGRRRVTSGTERGKLVHRATKNTPHKKERSSTLGMTTYTTDVRLITSGMEKRRLRMRTAKKRKAKQ